MVWKRMQQLPTLLGQERWELLAVVCKRTQQLPTLLGQECWELLAMVCKRMRQLPTMLGPARNKMQQGVQTDATYNIQQCCSFAGGFKLRSRVRILIYRTLAFKQERFH